MISGATVVYLSAVDWDAPWHGPQEIALRLGAAGNRVLYVETLGWRRPRSSDLPRAARRLARAARRRGAPPARLPEGVELLSPVLVPGARSRIGVAVNRALLLAALRRRLGSVTTPLILWIYTPSTLTAELPGALGESLCLYHCTQSHRHRPVAPPGTARAEGLLIERADLVVTDGIALYEERAPLAPHVYRIPSGVSPEPFGDARPPGWMARLPRPVLGYLGSVDHRIDPALLAAVADANPSATVAIVGPVSDIDVAGLAARGNVVLRPQVPIDEVPAVIAGFDVGLLPYADQPMTRYTYPAKLHQYLAGGLPIASTPLPDLEELSDLACRGMGPDGFVDAVARALASPRRGDERRALADRNTWGLRLEALSAVLSGHLDGHPPPGGPGMPVVEERPAPAEPALSVVVITWNERDDLARCLDALGEPSAGGREVIVIDNASDDGTATMLDERYPAVRVHRNRRNRGVTVARNQGLRFARGRHIAMLDSDTRPRPGALETLCGFLDANPDVGMVGPRLVYEDGALQMSCRRVPSPAAVIANRLTAVPALRDLPARRRYLMLDESHDTSMDVEYLLGAAMVFRREVVEQIGLFDERFGFSSPGGYGFDDADWGVRVKEAGWRVVYVPEAEIVHGYRRRLVKRPVSRQSLGLAASYVLLRAKGRRRRTGG